MTTTSFRVGQLLRAVLARGQNPWAYTVDEWFAFAVEAERVAKVCGPFDPATPIFIQQEQDALRMAELRQDADRYGFTESNTRAVLEAGVFASDVQRVVAKMEKCNGPQ